MATIFTTISKAKTQRKMISAVSKAFVRDAETRSWRRKRARVCLWVYV